MLGWPVFKVLDKESIFNGAALTTGGVCFILLAGLMWYILNRTAWGRHVYAVGDNAESALLAGRADRPHAALSLYRCWRHRGIWRACAHRPRWRHGDAAGG